MHYLVFPIGVAAVLVVSRNIYLRLRRLSQSRRLRGAQECLDAVQDTLTALAKSKAKVDHSRR